MRLSKTQRHLLEKAVEHGGSYAADWCSGQGAEGGKVSARLRERDAVFALEKRGLVQITNNDSGPQYKNGYAVWCSVASFRITAKGRAALMPTDEQFLAALGPCGK